MIVRWTVLLAGAVAVIVGVTGLLTPVRAGPQHVGCGTAIAADLSAARAVNATAGPGEPWPTALSDEPDIAEPIRGPVYVDYVALCRQDLTDRRLWTIPLAAVGILTVVGAAAAEGLARSRSARQATRR